MAIVTLRAYLDELQALIESEALEEVIGHCKYILQTYPKNVAVYRLLGSALLDKARYQEAADIFQRVLSAVPDDMIAHAAMFQIYQESDAVQPATWHLERAFEQNPNSQALKDELRNLYTRRDGAPPERVQMTRGGLARAYFQGQLYEQATAELETILAKEPNRADLLLLLARTYLANNHPIEAGETALRVLAVLPDALEANVILARLWLEHERPSDASPFIDRVQALDPFVALAILKPDDPGAGNALVLSRLDWNARATAALLTETPDWMENMSDMFDSSGRPANSPDPFGLERRATAAQPDWMSNFATPSETPVAASDWFAEAAVSGAPPAADPFAIQNAGDAVPDWFADVAASSERGLGNPRSQAAPEAEDPSWLQAASDYTAPAPQTNRQHSGFTDLLGEITTARQQDDPLPSWVDEQGSGAQPDWLQNFSSESSPAALDMSSAFSSDHPSAIDDLFSNWTPEATSPQGSEQDWANSSDTAAEPDFTDWMTNFESDSGTAQPPPATPTPVSQGLETNAATWLTDFNAESADSASSSDLAADTSGGSAWMHDDNRAESEMAWSAPAETSGAVPTAEEEWLSGFDSAKNSDDASAVDIPSWMGDASPVDVSSGWTAPAETAGTAAENAEDDWLSGMGNSSRSQPGNEPEAEHSSDNADNWLRDLGGTESAEPMAEAETGNVPDWMSGLAPSADTSTMAAEPLAADGDNDWLSGLGGFDSAQPEAEPAPANLPDWMADLAAPAEVPIASAEPVAADSDDDWLSGLGGIESAQPEAEPVPANLPNWMADLAAPAEAPIASAEPVAADDDDDWLSGLRGIDSAQPEAEPAPANLPDWMADLAAPEAPVASAEPVATVDNDDWLNDLSEPGTAEPVTEPEPANLPDWMSDLGLSTKSAATASQPETVDSDDDWLTGLGGVGTAEPAAEAETANAPEWLSALDPKVATDRFSAPAQHAADDDEWEQAFEPDIDTTELPHTVEVPSLATDSATDDWLSNVSAQPASKSEDWLSQFAVVGTLPDQSTPSTDFSPVSDLVQDEEVVPDWMRDTEQTSATVSTAVPDWMRDTERATVESEIDDDPLSSMFGSTVDQPKTATESADNELSGAYGKSHTTGMTGLLNAMALPKSDPTLTGHTDVLDESVLPDWMTAFNDEPAQRETQPDQVSDALDGDPTRQKSAASIGAMPVQESEPTAPVDAMVSLDEPFDSHDVPDWLSGLAPTGEPAAPIPPEPKTEILDLGAEPEIDIDSLLAGTSSEPSDSAVVGGDTSGEAEIPAWMRELAPERNAAPGPKAAPADTAPEAESGSGFSFKRRPAWLNKVKK